MLTTAPHLHIRRPSPTTAEFTVTTRPPNTLPLRLLLAAVFLGRLALGLSVVLLLSSKWAASPPLFSSLGRSSQSGATAADGAAVSPASGGGDILGDHHEGGALTPAPQTTTTQTNALLVSLLGTTAAALLERAAAAVAASPPGLLAARAAAAAPAWALLPLCAAALYLAVRRVHATESLLVLRGLGVQTASTGPTLLAGGGGTTTRFIATERIRDVLINEAFWGFGVRYYLVVVVDGEDDVVVVFPKLLPPRRIVEAVWRGVRGCLYEPDASGGGGHEKG